MKKRTSFTCLLLALSVLQSCKPRDCCSPVPVHPGMLYLSLQHEGHPAPDSLLNNTLLFYYQDGRKIYNPNLDANKPGNVIYNDTLLLERAVYVEGEKEWTAPGILKSRFVLPLVSQSGIREFYLQYPDSSLDTLSITVQKNEKESIASAACNCVYQVTGLRLNGQNIEGTLPAYPFTFPEGDNLVYQIEY